MIVGLLSKVTVPSGTPQWDGGISANLMCPLVTFSWLENSVGTEAETNRYQAVHPQAPMRIISMVDLTLFESVKWVSSSHLVGMRLVPSHRT